MIASLKMRYFLVFTVLWVAIFCIFYQVRTQPIKIRMLQNDLFVKKLMKDMTNCMKTMKSEAGKSECEKYKFLVIFCFFF